MSGWSRIIPEIGEIQPERVQEFSMTAVILNILSAMTAHWNREPDAIERRWGAFREIKQGVVGGIELSPSGEGAFH
jgi:hypothetical protein